MFVCLNDVFDAVDMSCGQDTLLSLYYYDNRFTVPVCKLSAIQVVTGPASRVLWFDWQCMAYIDLSNTLTEEIFASFKLSNISSVSVFLRSMYAEALMQLWHHTYHVSQKKSPLRTCGNFSKMVRNFLTEFYMPIVRSYLR